MPSTEFRMTHQRRVILQELRNVRSHPSADDIYIMVRKTLPRISLGTVYRNLEILSEMGLIKKLVDCGRQRRFDGNIENHYHIRCVKCGKIDDLPEEIVTCMEIDRAKIHGYSVLDHTIQFNGVCSECSN